MLSRLQRARVSIAGVAWSLSNEDRAQSGEDASLIVDPSEEVLSGPRPGFPTTSHRL
jgi:hypothetical protein